jgi:hypothetical protein
MVIPNLSRLAVLGYLDLEHLNKLIIQDLTLLGALPELCKKIAHNALALIFSRKFRGVML